MKKLFTLFAFLAVFMGAKADWVTDYTIDYSTYSDFPFYVMGYAPSIVDGVMVDNPVPYRKLWRGDESDYPGDDGMTEVTVNGATFKYQSLDANPWRQYFIADGIPTEIDGSYTVKAMVKASEQVTVTVNMGWGWGQGQSASASVTIGTEWAEVEWEYSGIGGNSCNLVAQPGTTEAVIEWKSLTVSHNQKETKPVEWVELISNGDASKSWAELGLADVAFTDVENTTKVCAWGKVNQGDPTPAKIEDNVFVVHATDCPDPTADASAWDNQFWIMSSKELKVGMQYKVHFRYKASQAAKTNTQEHSIQPSDYLHWAALGDVTFSDQWQEYDNTVTIQAPSAQGPAYSTVYSFAFNLNAEVKTATDFYFDDLSIQEMKLDEGYFVAGCNTDEGLEYDLANAIPFEGAGTDLVATVGAKGAYVNEIMISTIRGNDAAFKANTLKPNEAITNDPDHWIDYAPASLAKLKLPGSGIWKVYLDLKYSSMAFEMIEGTIKEPVDIVTNASEIVVNALERDWKPAKDDGTPQDGEEGIGEGQAWDNQFWMIANRVLDAGEATVVKFKYKAAKEARVSTQTHAAPGGYIHWAAIGDVNFTTDWQDFEADFVIPDEAAGKNMQSIAFNLSEIKDANDYSFKDFQWYLKSDVEGKTWENLINGTGKSNFSYKVKGGDITPAGIENINVDKKASAVIYNLSGQRVSKDYKGIVVSNGRKYIAK